MMTLNELSKIIDSLKEQEDDHEMEINIKNDGKVIDMNLTEDWDYYIHEGKIILEV